MPNARIAAIGGTPRLAIFSEPPADAPSPYAPSAPSPMPTAKPTAEPITPISNASSRTERSTCPRLAPIARSSASSWVRCATMIENVLRMRKMPTSTATRPKPTRT